jgi:hypothetical protein
MTQAAIASAISALSLSTNPSIDASSARFISARHQCASSVRASVCIEFAEIGENSVRK